VWFEPVAYLKITYVPPFQGYWPSVTHETNDLVTPSRILPAFLSGQRRLLNEGRAARNMDSGPETDKTGLSTRRDIPGLCWTNLETLWVIYYEENRKRLSAWAILLIKNWLGQPEVEMWDVVEVEEEEI
jgi:hypothetical protein